MRTLSGPIVVALLLLTRLAVAADEIKVMTSGAFTAAHLELAREFERATGHKILTEATSMGTGETSIPARLGRGEAIDVVIVADADLGRLIEGGRIKPGTRIPLARSAIGMAVRQGAPKPDISSVEALRRTLLAATSIAYSASVSGVYLSTELFQQLGVAERVLVGAVVARGEAEIGFQQISELLPIAGIDFVGPLPAAVQRVTVFAAGIGSAARHPITAQEFVRFLVSDAAVAVIRRSGLEAITSAR
jgi:molybdate transport system substrate-binding protein